jgi:hypothetical protein
VLGAGGTHTMVHAPARLLRRATTESILTAADCNKFDGVVDIIRTYVESQKRRRTPDEMLEKPTSVYYHAVSARWALALMECVGDVKLVPTNTPITMVGMPKFTPQQLENPWGRRQTPYARFSNTARKLLGESIKKGCYLNLFAEGHPAPSEDDDHECGEAAYRAMWVACCR